MTLVSMKIQKSVGPGPDGGPAAGTMMSDQPDYPYGLRISLDEKQLAALGVTELPKMGATFMIAAKVSVVGAHADPGDSTEPRRNLELQITDMEMEGNTEKTDAERAARIYTVPLSKPGNSPQ